MAQGLLEIDNTPLDPEGQALGLVNPVGDYIDALARIVLPAIPKTSTIVL